MSWFDLQAFDCACVRRSRHYWVKIKMKCLCVFQFKWPWAEKYVLEVNVNFFSCALHCLKFNVLT